MKATDFCFWLQGFFELQDHPDPQLNAAQTAMVKAHLAMVFKHEIDPSYGTPEHQAVLNTTHQSGKTNLFKPPPQPPVAHDHIHPGDVLMRC